MVPEGARLCAAVGTVFTGVRFLPRVDECVPLQRLLGGRSVLAVCASKRLFSGVNAQVIVEVEFPVCGIATIGTLVQFDTQRSRTPRLGGHAWLWHTAGIVRPHL